MGVLSKETADLPTHEVVTRVLDGDRQAFRHLIKRYESDVMAIAHAMLRDRDAVEDVVQEVFVRAFRYLDRFDTEASFGLWIKGIARNTVREELRKKYRYRGRIEEYAKLTEERLDDPRFDLFNDEVREALETCLSRLEANSARAIRMHYLEHRKTDEIAKTLGRSGGSVRTMMHRARAALRDCLIEKEVVA